MIVLSRERHKGLIQEQVLCPTEMVDRCLVSWVPKPTDIILDPSQQKTSEGLSSESRANMPGCSLRSGAPKRAEFIVEMIVYLVQQTAQKLSGAVQVAPVRWSANEQFGVGFITLTPRDASRLQYLLTVIGA